MGKDDLKIIVVGDLDEASSFLGLARAEADGEIGGLVIELQRLLYRVMGDVAMPKEDNVVGEEDLKFLDDALEEWRSRTEIPSEFVIPGESKPGALLDVARTVTRRASCRLSTMLCSPTMTEPASSLTSTARHYSGTARCAAYCSTASRARRGRPSKEADR